MKLLNYFLLLYSSYAKISKDDFKFCGNQFKMDIVFMVDTGHGDSRALNSQKKLITNLVDWLPPPNSRRNFHQEKVFPFQYKQNVNINAGGRYTRFETKPRVRKFTSWMTLTQGSSIPVSQMTDESLNLFERAFQGSKSENKKVVVLLHSGHRLVDKGERLDPSFWSDSKKPEDIPFVISVTPKQFSPSQLLKISENHCYVFQPTKWETLYTVENMIKVRQADRFSNRLIL